VGFFSTTDEIAASYTRPGASTFGGNPVTAQAGLKFLEILQRQALVEHSARMETLLQDRLRKLAEPSEVISEVRGLGLMVGVEIAAYGTLSPAESTDRILERMKDSGYLLGKTGPGREANLPGMPHGGRYAQGHPGHGRHIQRPGGHGKAGPAEAARLRHSQPRTIARIHHLEARIRG
jgi:hypothetical protein